MCKLNKVLSPLRVRTVLSAWIFEMVCHHFNDEWQFVGLVWICACVLHPHPGDVMCIHSLKMMFISSNEHKSAWSQQRPPSHWEKSDIWPIHIYDGIKESDLWERGDDEKLWRAARDQQERRQRWSHHILSLLDMILLIYRILFHTYCNDIMVTLFCCHSYYRIYDDSVIIWYQIWFYD